jgi:hypothetical protein
VASGYGVNTIFITSSFNPQHTSTHPHPHSTHTPPPHTHTLPPHTHTHKSFEAKGKDEFFDNSSEELLIISKLLHAESSKLEQK